MFSVKQGDDRGALNQLVIQNEEADTYAIIDLNLGGSLQELKLRGKQIIKDLHPFDYKASFASAILFPFVNRIENGTYTFNNQNYQLQVNDPDGHHALHGLVYDKRFELVSEESSLDSASVSISFREYKKLEGYPFLYEVHLTYVLDAMSLTLSASIKNIDSVSFPFSLGWHPYFYSSDLFESYVNINSQVEALTKKEGFQFEKEEVDFNSNLQIKNTLLDDCYYIRTNTLEFTTPDYCAQYSVSTEDSYLQLYTPPTRNALAIELQTSPANAFNNKIGLQILQPNDTFNMNWKIELKPTN